MRGVRLRESDLLVERLRRSGPGGQHRNRRATGVRLTHLPTGISVMATERRSQGENLENARARLKARLEKLFAQRRPRIRTAPGPGAAERRLKAKKARAETKRRRRAVRWDD